MSNTVFLAWRETSPGQGSQDARELLAALYRGVTGEGMPPLVKTPLGKPLFFRSSWHCSITHTKSLVCCAMSLSPIGVDAEALDRPIRPSLPPKVLTPGELSRYEQTGDKALFFLTHWVLKEAYLKYTGEGLTGDWRNAEFRVQKMEAALVGSDLSFSLFRRHGHMIALCCEKMPQVLFVGDPDSLPDV